MQHQGGSAHSEKLSGHLNRQMSVDDLSDCSASYQKIKDAVNNSYNQTKLDKVDISDTKSMRVSIKRDINGPSHAKITTISSKETCSLRSSDTDSKPQQLVGTKRLFDQTQILAMEKNQEPRGPKQVKEKKQKRLVQNRESAKKSRLKKKEEHTDMMYEMEKLQDQSKAMKNQLNEVTSELYDQLQSNKRISQEYQRRQNDYTELLRKLVGQKQVQPYTSNAKSLTSIEVNNLIKEYLQNNFQQETKEINVGEAKSKKHDVKDPAQSAGTIQKLADKSSLPDQSELPAVSTKSYHQTVKMLPGSNSPVYQSPKKYQEQDFGQVHFEKLSPSLLCQDVGNIDIENKTFNQIYENLAIKYSNNHSMHHSNPIQQKRARINSECIHNMFKPETFDYFSKQGFNKIKEAQDQDNQEDFVNKFLNDN